MAVKHESGRPYVIDEALTETRTCVLEAIGVVSPATSQQCPVYLDQHPQMTGGRLVARFLSRFSLYCSPDSRASLDKAWAHYEHATLARIGLTGFERATPGDVNNPTRLYPLWETPTQALGAFGISVRLYFSSLLFLASFLGLAGVLNLGMSSYFWSVAYSSDKFDYWPAVRASAVCMETDWVQCGGSCQQQRDAYYSGRWYDDENEVSNSKYLLRNVCDFDSWFWPGLLSYAASIMLIVLSGITFFWLQRKAEVIYDEEMQTTSDYAVKVSNPPPDATDPNEWREYLQTFGPVTACSVAINNSKLLRKLVERKKALKRLAFSLPIEFDVNDRGALAAAAADDSGWKFPFIPTTQSLYRNLLDLEEEIQTLLHPAAPYKAVAVFVIFETERAQRNALHSLSTGKWNVWRNQLDTNRFDAASNRLLVEEAAESSKFPKCDGEEMLSQVLMEDAPTDMHKIQLVEPAANKRSLVDVLLFRGQHVVHVKAASEPNDVRWKDLQVPSAIRFLKYMGSTLALIWFVCWAGFFIYDLEDTRPEALPYFIAITNVVVPKICDFINSLEAHSTEQSRQESLYIKVTLFRWFNSAIALTIVVGFNKSITPDRDEKSHTLAQAVYNIIFAELFTIPLIKLVDVMGFIRKHILAPRARDQEEMNSYFIGGKFELAERYTDATKVLFVSLFYSAILPQSLFLGAIALLIHFAVGKFCLLRIWRPSADIGPSLSRLSRNYFLSVSLLVHVIMSAYWWSGYPYDNLCESDDGSYSFCNQDFLRSGVFPPLPQFQPQGSEWMTSSQATITSMYSWTAVFALLAGAVFLFKQNVLPFFQSLFVSTYVPNGKDQGIEFSSVVHLYGVHAYIPQLRETGFAYPLLACDLSQVNQLLVGWKDPFHDYKHHSLVDDAREIMGGCEPEHVVFSQVRYWPRPKSEMSNNVVR